MTNLASFSAERYLLSSCTLEAGLIPEEAHFLSELLVTMDPWRTLRYSADALAQYLLRHDPALHRFTIMVHGKTSGIVCIRYPWLLGPYLELFCVDPRMQGSGVGNDILSWLEDQARITSRNVWALVSGFNAKAREFYRQHGYQEIAAIKDLVEIGHDEVLLRKVVRRDS